jgi:hypothetical protein
MDPLITSSLVSAGSSLLGGVFGKKKKRGPSWQDQLTMQRQATRQEFALMDQMSKKYKIHPLAMMGSQLPQLSTVYQSEGGSNMGQNIAQSISKGASTYFTGKANKEMNDLALERAELENELLRSQITSINNPATAGSAYSNDQRVLNVPDENVRRSEKEPGLTAGSENPPPAGKRFTVGNTPYGEVYITLPASGQADEYGEVYGAIKGLEYLAKRGYVHYSRGVYRYGKKLRSLFTDK